MNRASLAVTTTLLVVLIALFSPRLVPSGPASGSSPGTPVPTPTSCPRPSFGAFDTDAVLICLAASHQQRP